MYSKAIMVKLEVWQSNYTSGIKKCNNLLSIEDM